jgi:hypothetical protein
LPHGQKKALMAGLLRGHPQAMMRTIRAPVVPGSSLTLMSRGVPTGTLGIFIQIRRSPPRLSPWNDAYIDHLLSRPVPAGPGPASRRQRSMTVGRTRQDAPGSKARARRLWSALDLIPVHTIILEACGPVSSSARMNLPPKNP